MGSDPALTDDPYRLTRFVEAQNHVYEDVLAELRVGRKTSHWMWFIFPQVAGLGSSGTSRYYAIESIEEARAYLAHDILGSRLAECVEILLQQEERSVHEIFGYPDDMKLKSSMTLFAHASRPGSPFEKVLERFFGGDRDQATLEILGVSAS